MALCLWVSHTLVVVLEVLGVLLEVVLLGVLLLGVVLLGVVLQRVLPLLDLL
jgi:hypothetical protein